MFGLDILDTLFVVWAFFFQIVHIVHFAVRKRVLLVAACPPQPPLVGCIRGTVRHWHYSERHLSLSCEGS